MHVEGVRVVTYLAPVFLAVVAIAAFFKRRELASFQANILGGAVMPGCVIAEAIVLVVLAIVMIVLA